MSCQIFFKPNRRAYLGEAHVRFRGLPLSSYLDVGLYERYPKDHYKQKTEGYPLIGSAFWRDDYWQITWAGKANCFYWRLSAGNGYSVGERSVSEDNATAFRMMADRASDSDFHCWEWGLNMGIQTTLAEKANLDVLGFIYTDGLSDEDMAELQASLPGYDSHSRTKRRWGTGIKLTYPPFTFYTQCLKARDGELDRDGWFAELSYKIKLRQNSWFTAVEPVLSYGVLNVDWDKAPGSPWSWDREKLILALIFDLCPNVKLKAEYYWNQEDTGDGQVDNNECLLQLEIKF
jgi:hypothetical protein